MRDKFNPYPLFAIFDFTNLFLSGRRNLNYRHYIMFPILISSVQHLLRSKLRNPIVDMLFYNHRQ